MTTEFKQVSHEEFQAFIAAYPGNLTADCCGISEPPLVSYSDFEVASGFDAIVAKYHLYNDPAKRVYRIRDQVKP